jgi:hypothetical protein
MQQSVESQSSSPPSSFAGLLAALTQPEKKKPPEWNDNGLADDVTTLSYERALQARARYRTADRPNWTFAPEGLQGASNGQQAAQLPVAGAGEDLPARSGATDSPVPGRDLRRTSVTIRLSDAESVQLHERAAEAGLTVSAYLRSCAFEAEALRAQVKAALAELRTAGRSEKATARNPTLRLRFGWLARIWPRWKPRQRVARA